MLCHIVVENLIGSRRAIEHQVMQANTQRPHIAGDTDLAVRMLSKKLFLTLLGQDRRECKGGKGAEKRELAGDM